MLSIAHRLVNLMRRGAHFTLSICARPIARPGQRFFLTWVTSAVPSADACLGSRGLMKGMCQLDDPFQSPDGVIFGIGSAELAKLLQRLCVKAMQAPSENVRSLEW